MSEYPLLNKLIAQSFSLDEFDEIKIQLGIDPESIMGSKPSQARDLIQFVSRRKQVQKLLQILSELRPSLDLSNYLYLVMAYDAAYNDSEFRDWRQSLNLPLLSPDHLKEAQTKDIQDVLYAQGQKEVLIELVHDKFPELDISLFSPGVVNSEIHASVNNTPSKTTNNQGHSVQPTIYDNFDVFIRPAGNPNEYSLEAKSPYGETAAAIHQLFPFEDEEYQYLARSLRDVQISEPQFADEMGEILRKFLFPPQIQEEFSKSLNVSRAKGKEGVRVRLNINQELGEMYQVPWEYCRDDKSFLALNADTPLVRYIPTNREPVPISTPNTVKILLAWANPADLAQLDVQSEIDAVKEALAEFTASGRVEIEELPNVTPTTLVSKVRQNPPHIFHFIGHGAMLKTGGGALALDNGRNAHALLDGNRMLRLFQGDDTKLIILSACQSGATSDKSQKSSSAEAFMGLAPKLVWGGLPAVVAMQYDLPNQAARPFMQTLYEFLALGKPLDTAVTEARIGLDFNILESPYWGIPVLFMRAPDGNIWA